MLLKDLIEYAVAKANLGKPDEVDAALWTFALQSLNRAAEEIWRGWNWDNGKIVSLSVTTDEAVIVFPYYVDHVMAARRDSTPLTVRDEVLINQFEPTRFEAVGSPTEFIILPFAAVEAQPEAAGLLSLISSANRDVGVYVHVEGVDEAGNRVAEVVQLNGPIAVQTTKQYAEVTSLSKEAAAGTITVSDAAANVLAKIQPQDDRTAFRRVRLVPDPDGTEYTVHFIAKRKFCRLTNNYDVFPLDRCESALIDMLIADLLEYDQRDATIYRQAASAKLGEAVRIETEAQAREMRVVPAMLEFTPEMED